MHRTGGRLWYWGRDGATEARHGHYLGLLAAHDITVPPGLRGADICRQYVRAFARLLRLPDGRCAVGLECRAACCPCPRLVVVCDDHGPVSVHEPHEFPHLDWTTSQPHAIAKSNAEFLAKLRESQSAT